MSQAAANTQQKLENELLASISFSEGDIAIESMKLSIGDLGLPLLESTSKNASIDMVQTATMSIQRIRRDIDNANEELGRFFDAIETEAARLKKVYTDALISLQLRRDATGASFNLQNNERASQIRALSALINVLQPKQSTVPAAVPPAAAPSVHSGPRAAQPVTAAAIPTHATAPIEKGGPTPMTPAAAAAVSSIQDGK